MKEVKVQIIKEPSVYESFQLYSHDPYLGKAITQVIPMHETYPIRESADIRNIFLTRYKGLVKMVEGE